MFLDCVRKLENLEGTQQTQGEHHAKSAQKTLKTRSQGLYEFKIQARNQTEVTNKQSKIWINIFGWI